MVIDELKHGNRLEFRDFGVFEIKHRASRKAQNPKTLEPVLVPPKRTVKFKVGRLMKQQLDDSTPRGSTTLEPVMTASVEIAPRKGRAAQSK